MSTQEHISKLQGLLSRIQRNASKPREPGAPLAFAAPTQGAASPAPAPQPAPADQSVDDLLSAGPSLSPLPSDADMPLETIPPEPAAPAPSEFPEAEPIPLVSVATAEPAAPAAYQPPGPDDSFSLDSEVSEVRIAAISREPAVEVTVAAIEAEAEPLAPEELSEDDLVEVEITDLTSAPPPADADVDIDFEDEDEEPPASSQRKVATTMDEALAAAAAELDVEHEAPLKTPPPESGPQEAPPYAAAITSPAAPDVDALLGQELDIPTRESTSIPVAPAAGPTAEQLGQTVDLDEARGPSLELAEAPATAAASPPVEELEVALPSREAVGGYDAGLMPPPEARDELHAHLRRQEDEDLAPPPESLAQLPSVQPPPVDIVPPAPVIEAAPFVEPAAALDAPAPLSAELTSRPVPFGSPESFASVREPFRPHSFVELLDASLALNGD